MSGNRTASDRTGQSRQDGTGVHEGSESPTGGVVFTGEVRAVRISADGDGEPIVDVEVEVSRKGGVRRKGRH